MQENPYSASGEEVVEGSELAKLIQAWDEGYKAGHEDGYEDGHEDGWLRGYAR